MSGAAYLAAIPNLDKENQFLTTARDQELQKDFTNYN